MTLRACAAVLATLLLAGPGVAASRLPELATLIWGPWAARDCTLPDDRQATPKPLAIDLRLSQALDGLLSGDPDQARLRLEDALALSVGVAIPVELSNRLTRVLRWLQAYEPRDAPGAVTRAAARLAAVEALPSHLEERLYAKWELARSLEAAGRSGYVEMEDGSFRHREGLDVGIAAESRVVPPRRSVAQEVEIHWLDHLSVRAQARGDSKEANDLQTEAAWLSMQTYPDDAQLAVRYARAVFRQGDEAHRNGDFDAARQHYLNAAELSCSLYHSGALRETVDRCQSSNGAMAVAVLGWTTPAWAITRVSFLERMITAWPPPGRPWMEIAPHPGNGGEPLEAYLEPPPACVLDAGD